MSTLDRAYRKKLSDTIIAARELAEEAAADAVRRLGIVEDEGPEYLTSDQKALRVRLRAHARTLGDKWIAEKKKLLTTKQLENEAAYEIWHRMLFGRFLVERGLLIHPDLGVPIATSELADLAREAGAADPWALVERFATPSLPAVFKRNDPVLAMTLDPALAKRLRDLVAELPAEVFTADDSLGWTYQFWRTAEKEAVNKSGAKIGAVELPAVTQLFTEPYMVKFLLHNTLGAWWAGKVLAGDQKLAQAAADEQSLRDACALPGVEWDYLRFVRDGEAGPWSPAAGAFPDWPSKASEITYCDPCCGSGHFLVEAFAILAALRQHEEGLSGDAAACAVLQDNLHGLELDERCVQIAVFNVALAAWKLAGSAALLPQPHVAWVGAPPPFSESEMAALAGSDVALRGALTRLHNQFKDAALLGSLLDIGARDLLDDDLRKRGHLALAKLREAEAEQAVGAIAALGLLDATEILGRKYVLLATNVPFLGQRKQVQRLADFIAKHWAAAKADLATAMLSRILEMAEKGGVAACVTPQNWLFLDGYRGFRDHVLKEQQLSFIVGVGARGFETISGEVVNAALVAISNLRPSANASFGAIDANSGTSAGEKASLVRAAPVRICSQSEQRANPDSRIVLAASYTAGSKKLADFVDTFQGIKTGDDECYLRFFWENRTGTRGWRYLQTTVEQHAFWGGASLQVWWKADGRHLIRRREEGQAMARKYPAVSVGQMSALPCSLLATSAFDSNVSPLFVRDPVNLPAIYTYCTSAEFHSDVRALEPSLKANNGVLLKVPFDIARWRAAARAKFPDGLPAPYSDDPTQWLFHGHPAHAEQGTHLHVALARVIGYRWPAETDQEIELSDLGQERVALAARLPEADQGGLASLDPTAHQVSLADRLRTLLSAAFGTPLSPIQEADLIRAADNKFDKRQYRDARLETWLRDRAFRQHCALFQHRPFLWHIWDGLAEGFSIFVNYHHLDYGILEKLTFTVLGDWIANARVEGQTAKEGRALQLQQRLRAILDGENPYDIFVRWKTLERQPIGWRPDLDDGVRLNIRPFIATGVLRDLPRINWGKDRGSDAPSAPWYSLGPLYGGKEGDRVNDHHLTLAEKRLAHRQAG
jgi:hypothetical protein